MASCPETHQLIDLLDEHIEPAALDELVTHIEGCPLCQSRLEWLTDRQGLLSSLGAGDEGSQGLPFSGPFDTTDFPSASSIPGTDLFPNEVEPGPATTEPDGPARPPCPVPGTVDEPDPSGTIEYRGLPGSGDHETVDQPGDRQEPDLLVGASAEGDRTPGVPGYDVGRLLGEGGMGVVYQARHRQLNRSVALKMIRDGGLARPGHLMRFRIEAEAVARLQHPNVVQIFDVGESGGLPFVALELLEGGSLADRLDGTPLPGREAAALVAVLARAVQAAHVAGIVHRDLKPANVLYTADGVPKITDFGIAKRLEDDRGQTETGQIMGTPCYMAPEQAGGKTREIGPAVDIYSLGSILYEALTGRPPFKGETTIETIRQVVHEEVVPPSRLVPKVARDLETICLACLSKEPSKRYASAGALADDLERYRAGESVLARRAHVAERAIRWSRRRPAAALLVALAIAACLSITAGGVLYLRELGLRDRRALELVQQGNRRIDAARLMTSAEDLSQAKVDLSKFLVGLETAPETRYLPTRIKTALGEVERRLREISTSEAREEQGRAERQQYQAFRGLRTQVHLNAAEFELDPANRLAKLRDSARTALAVYAEDPGALDDAWSLSARLPAALSAREKADVAEACYDLLLLLSQAFETTKGLRILDRAARLRAEPTAAYHMRRAEYLARSGDSAGQRREEELAGSLPAVTALDHFLIGRERLGRRQWDEAIVALETAVGLDPDLTAARLLLAIASFDVQPKRLTEALSNLNDCIRRHPDLVGLHLLRALVHGEVGNQALSRIDPEQPARVEPLREQALRAFKAAEADYGTALDRHPSEDLGYALLVNRGGMYLQAGQFAESLSDLEEAIKLKPDPYQAYSHMAQLRQRQGRTEDASRAFGEAIERASDAATVAALRRSRARLQVNRRDATPEQRTAALADLEEAIRLDPDDPRQTADDHVVRAQLLFGGARFEEALDAGAEVLKLVPDHAAALRLRISALMALKRYDDVLGSCDAYLASGEPSVEILEIRVLARVARRNYSGAIGDYTHAVQLRPDLDRATRARLLKHRGWAYHFTDAPRLALEDFEGSLKLIKDQGDALAGRGLARIRLGDWRPAVADAEAAVRLARLAPTEEGGAGAGRQAHFNAARIYAQAVPFAAAEVSREGERAIALYRAYRSRAQDLLQQALRETPESDRARLLSDPALGPLRPRPMPGPDTRARPTELSTVR